ncbi:HAD-IIIC family phosphatase [Bradyrhizobium sp. HKCCYLS20291]|uniref:HAD-IIIC family phosphatase n=1 Tax=Bradyrhizobium sp. HKCCYLS20291 TaxID=3420766 RepID=UPI003EBE1B5F
MMTEAVRLVIWDLDETFWKGTITEGGITEYIQQHHDIVIELAKRGILSSVCSKNDPDIVLPILRETGILDYFVFPSISWDPKGMRIAQLVDAVQLRAATILFIDDNPNNRAEAAAVVPGLQVEDETFIGKMLDDPRFKGKNDTELSRLKQYKLLEQKKEDEQSSAGSNEDFLRHCDVRVFIDYDIDLNIDRAIELINRTNQLNFTKRRLPDDLEKARKELRKQLEPFDCQAGLIRVLDKYGDYGYVGFFMTVVHRTRLVDGLSNTRLVHFCFSCRTLGMLVEKWVYDFLGRPELKVMGDVLTDLSVERSIDWVRQIESVEQTASPTKQVAPEIIVYGGCEAHMVGVYLNAFTSKLTVYGNYAANGLFVRINNASTALDVCDRDPRLYSDESELLGLPLSLQANDLFAKAAPGSLFVFNLTFDATPTAQLRHKRYGWMMVVEPRQLPGRSFFDLSEADLNDPTASYSDEQKKHVIDVRNNVRAHYEIVAVPSEEERVQNVRDLIARIPLGSKFIIAINHHESRPNFPSENTVSNDAIRRYTSVMAKLASEYPYVAMVSVSEVINSVHDMRGADHYTREVYLRFANKIIEVASDLEGRSDPPLPKEQLLADSARLRATIRKEGDYRELVTATYQCLLRREPDPFAEGYVQKLATGQMLPAEFIRTITRSNEFALKWSPKTVNPSEKNGAHKLIIAPGTLTSSSAEPLSANSL